MRICPYKKKIQDSDLIITPIPRRILRIPCPGDPSTTIVGAGERLAQILQNKYGYQVMHHKGEYDVEARDYAYSNSLPEIEKIIEENPSIEVVIDLHRMRYQKIKSLVTDLQGRPTAKLCSSMFKPDKDERPYHFPAK